MNMDTPWQAAALVFAVLGLGSLLAALLVGRLIREGTVEPPAARPPAPSAVRKVRRARPYDWQRDGE